MNAIFQWFLKIVALTLMGVFAAFFVFLNYLKQEEKRNDYENGKTNK